MEFKFINKIDVNKAHLSMNIMRSTFIMDFDKFDSNKIFFIFESFFPI